MNITFAPEPDYQQEAMDAMREHEQRTYPVACSICGIADVDTEPNLRRAGWLLAGTSEICPADMKTMEWSEIGRYGKAVEAANA